MKKAELGVQNNVIKPIGTGERFQLREPVVCCCVISGAENSYFGNINL